MAITRAQQVRQMLEEGGILVSPSMDGKRKGYRFGFDRGKETKADKGVDKGDGPSQRQREQSKFEDQSYSNPNRFATKEDVREQARVGNQIKEGDFLSPATTTIGGQQFNVIPGDDRNVQERIFAENLQKRINQQNRDKFINTKTTPKPLGFPLFDASVNFVNKFLPSQVTRKFYYDNVRGRTVTLPDGSVITFDEDNYDEYDTLRKAGVIGAYGNTEMGQNAIDARGGPDDGEGGSALPDDPGDGDGDKDDDTNTGGLAIRFRKDGGRINAMDGGMMSPEGGIMDLETGRQMYFLGKLVKKASRALKKITKSPLGKAALLGGAMYFGGGGAGGFSGLLKKGLLKKGATEFTLANLSPMKTIGLASLGSAFLTPEEEEDDELYRGPGLDIRKIRENPYDFLGPNFANGGRIGLKDGNGVADEEAENAKFVKRVRELMDEGFDMGEAVKEAMKEGYAEGGRTGFFMGSKLPQGLALVRQMLKFFSEGSKTGKTGSEMLKIVNPKQFTKYLEDPNTLFMKGSTKDGIMASDVVKDYASKVKGERAKMIEDLLGSAKNINKANKSTEKFKKEIIEEMISKGSNKEAAESSAEILSSIAENAAGGKEIMKYKPKITEEGILQLEQIVKNLKTGGKTARDLNAQGGRIGLKGGTGSKILNFLKPFGGETKGGKQLEGLLYGSEGIGEILRLLSSSGMFAEGGDVEPVAKKTMPLLDMGGKEMDLRDDGGFVPIGRMEKADDVPARLSKNEFVFTADAVRNAGEGDVDKGAEVMYNMMKNLESGGEVSEESQGLEGAREMFQTSKRLEEVL